MDQLSLYLLLSFLAPSLSILCSCISAIGSYIHVSTHANCSATKDYRKYTNRTCTFIAICGMCKTNHITADLYAE